jgi:hypothetical protein
MRWSLPLPLAFLALVLPSVGFGAPDPVVRAQPHRVASPAGIALRDSARRIDGNRINMFVTNLGSFACDLSSSNAGLIWPRGTDLTAVFASGLWVAAKVGGATRAALGDLSTEYGPGPMVGGGFDDPLKPQHRVYKVVRWSGNSADSAHVTRSASERAADPKLDPLLHHSWSEYVSGAAPYGAPTRLYRLPVTATPDPADSIDVPGPDVVGDQMLWSVYNDADAANHTHAAGSTAPLGIEVQHTTFAFDAPENLRNTVFMRFRIVNKGSNTLDSAFVALWCDPDLGSFIDDMVGCDTTRSLGFCFNSRSSDMAYGIPPPALGYVLLRGPVNRASGDTLGMTSFVEYVGGNDPASATESYRLMRGLLRNGDAFAEPVTGRPTPFAFSGDPVRGFGWLDSLARDERMVPGSGPFQMAPGDTQEVVAAITVGRGGSHLASVGAVRCQADVARALYGAGFDLTRVTLPASPCSTMATYVTTNCPRTASFWVAEFAFGGGLLSVPQLTQVARAVDSLSTLFDWPIDAFAGFRAVIDPPGTLDLRQEATREYAAFMANLAAGRLGLLTTADEPIWLNSLSNVECPTPRTRTIEVLAKAVVVAPRFRSATYLNDVPDHRRALEGVPVGLADFNGGAGPARGFLGSGLDPVAHADSFPTVEIRFDHALTQIAYRYLRLERQSDGGAPPQGRAYLFRGLRSVPFSFWDAVSNVQLEAGFVERALTDDAGTILAPAFQPATFDSAWRPDESASGGHEYVLVFRRPYGGPKPELAQDGVPESNAAPTLYALAARLRVASDVIDDGDRFLFSWGRPPVPSADSILVDNEPLPIADPAVQSAYRDLTACLASINAGVGIEPTCASTTSSAISVVSIEADSTRVAVTWLSAVVPLFAFVERRFEEGTWVHVGLASAGADGLLVFIDTDVVAGGHYEYRLAVDVGGRVEYFGLAVVDVPGRSRFAFFGARPNPATANLVLSFSLASRLPARLQILDITGRRVLERDLIGLGPGQQVLDLGDSGRFRAGVYLVRITQEGRRIAGKYAIVH